MIVGRYMPYQPSGGETSLIDGRYTTTIGRGDLPDWWLVHTGHWAGRPSWLLAGTTGHWVGRSSWSMARTYRPLGRETSQLFGQYVP
jgi:hypothetical protein